MTTFHYHGFDASGKPCRGLIEAADARQARKKLALREIFSERMVPAGEIRPGFFGRTKVPAGDRAAIYREIGSALRAGIPLARAMDMIVESPETGRASIFLAAARDRINDGVSAASALGEAMPGIQAHETALVEAGEKTATLDSSLEKLADFLDEQVKTRASIVSVMLYPALVLVLGALMAAGLLGFAVPRIGLLLRESGDSELPLLTRAVMAFGAAAVRWFPPALAAVAVAALWLRNRIKRSRETRTELDRLLFRLPLYGHGYSLLAKLRFCRTLSVLLAGGTPPVEAMTLAGKSTGSCWLETLATEQANAVRHGDAMSLALRRIPVFSRDLCNWVEIGEASGNLAQMLDSAAQRFRAKWDIFVSRASALLEPVLILLVGAFVFVVVLATLLPIISLNTALH